LIPGALGSVGWVVVDRPDYTTRPPDIGALRLLEPPAYWPMIGQYASSTV